MLKRNLRITVIALYVTFLLFASTAYAATTGELGFSGIAFVQEYDANNQFMYFPIPDANGFYFTSANMPAGVSIGAQNWEGNVFHLTIYKNSTINGNIQFQMDFNLYNMTNVNWPAGTVEVVYKYSTGAANNAMFPTNYIPTLSAPAMNANDQGSVIMNYSGKITEGIIDAIMFYAEYTFTDPFTQQVVQGRIYFMVEFRAPSDPPHNGWPAI